MTTFSGLDPAAPAFFARLARDNTAATWHAHLDEYRDRVRTPFESLLDELSGTHGPWRVFRAQRDVRFSRDKSPYKTHLGAVTRLPGGTVYSLRIDAHGLRVGAGMARMAHDQLARFRVAIDDAVSGDDFLRRVDSLPVAGDGLAVTGGRLERLKTAPRGFSRTHPRLPWLQVKGVEVVARLGTPAWLASDQAPTEILRVFERSRSLTQWLDRHVGPSHLPPERPERQRRT